MEFTQSWTELDAGVGFHLCIAFFFSPGELEIKDACC